MKKINEKTLKEFNKECKKFFKKWRIKGAIIATEDCGLTVADKTTKLELINLAKTEEKYLEKLREKKVNEWLHIESHDDSDKINIDKDDETDTNYMG